MITKKICPNCKSEEIEGIATGINGGWMCKKCGYNGNMLEVPLINKQGTNENDKVIEDIKSSIKQNKTSKKANK